MMAGTDIDWLRINMKSWVTTVYLLLMSGLLSRPTGSQRELSEPCSFPLILRTTEWPWKILSQGKGQTITYGRWGPKVLGGICVVHLVTPPLSRDHKIWQYPLFSSI